MYVGGEMCWEASKMATELGDLLRGMRKNDEELEQIVNERAKNATLSIQFTQYSEENQENLENKANSRFKRQRLLDLTA